jgi:hypothetical protein
LVNVSQQVGSTLGLAVLVTVFASAARHAAATAPGAAAGTSDAFVAGADRALLVAAALILTTSVVAMATHRAPWRRRPRVSAEPLLDYFD